MFGENSLAGEMVRGRENVSTQKYELFRLSSVMHCPSLECRLIKRSDSVVPATDGTPDKENIRAAGGGQTGREKGPVLSSAVDSVERGPEQGQAHRTGESWWEPDGGSRLRRAADPRGARRRAHTCPCRARWLCAVQQVPRGGEGEVKAAALRAPSNFPPRPSRLESSPLPARGYRSDEHGGGGTDVMTMEGEDTEVMTMEGGTKVMKVGTPQ